MITISLALSALAAANADRVGDIVGNWKAVCLLTARPLHLALTRPDATRIKEQFSVNGINAVTVFDDTSPGRAKAHLARSTRRETFG